MVKVGRRALAMLTAAVMAVATSAAPEGAAAQDLSDRSVKVLMDYAWLILPSKFTASTGKVIEVDKSKREENSIPVDVARRVIKVARLSAHAQICELPVAQAANYKTMMKQHEGAGTWSDQQMLYISQLHLFTVMWLTGNVKLVDKGGSKEVVVSEKGADSKTQSCTEAEKQKVLQQIKKYVCEDKPDHIIGCTS